MRILKLDLTPPLDDKKNVQFKTLFLSQFTNEAGTVVLRLSDPVMRDASGNPQPVALVQGEEKLHCTLTHDDLLALRGFIDAIINMQKEGQNYELVANLCSSMNQMG